MRGERSADGRAAGGKRRRLRKRERRRRGLRRRGNALTSAKRGRGGMHGVQPMSMERVQGFNGSGCNQRAWGGCRDLMVQGATNEHGEGAGI
eukprot:299786-Chlamydomonas_euryale.AAC.2